MPSKKINPAFTPKYKKQCHAVFNQIEEELGVRDPGLALVIRTDWDNGGYALIKYTCKDGRKFNWLKLTKDWSNKMKELVPRITNSIDSLDKLLTGNRISGRIQRVGIQRISKSPILYDTFLVDDLTATNMMSDPQEFYPQEFDPQLFNQDTWDTIADDCWGFDTDTDPNNIFDPENFDTDPITKKPKT